LFHFFSISKMATSVPVPFADIGKSSNDLLGKDFPVGQTKLELKTVAPNGVVSFSFTLTVFKQKAGAFTLVNTI
jgi:hypothetical protein